MTETDVKGCQESIKSSARDNNAIAWGLERRVVFDNKNTISGDDDVLKIAFDIDYFGSLLRRSGTLTEVRSCVDVSIYIILFLYRNEGAKDTNQVTEF